MNHMKNHAFKQQAIKKNYKYQRRPYDPQMIKKKMLDPKMIVKIEYFGNQSHKLHELHQFNLKKEFGESAVK